MSLKLICDGQFLHFPFKHLIQCHCVTIRGFGTPWRTHNDILIASFIQHTCGEHLLRMWHLLRSANRYDYTINSSTKRLDTYGGNPSAPASSSAPARSSESGIPSELEIPGSDLPYSGIHLARFPMTPLAFPWRFPIYVATRLPRKDGYPRTGEGLSLLPRTFRRHQHPPHGCQPRSVRITPFYRLTQNTSSSSRTPKRTPRLPRVTTGGGRQ